ncbi:MAG TPA: metal-dependent transcriptional regulator [Phycisphaerae bacterium]|nr:metal-dependent transcriptional regulator [Phycisphaerae bacterium]
MAQMLSESLEDYLEAIFHIVSAKQAARATDISDRMGVSRSSVTGALRALAERELVNYAPYDIVTLTPAGMAAAENIVQRHQVLRRFFVEVLGVDEEIADAAACGMEHHVGKVVLRKLACLAEFIADGPGGGEEAWLAGFRVFCRAREGTAAAPGVAGT